MFTFLRFQLDHIFMYDIINTGIKFTVLHKLNLDDWRTVEIVFRCNKKWRQKDKVD